MRINIPKGSIKALTFWHKLAKINELLARFFDKKLLGNGKVAGMFIKQSGIKTVFVFSKILGQTQRGKYESFGVFQCQKF